MTIKELMYEKYLILEIMFQKCPYPMYSHTFFEIVLVSRKLLYVLLRQR